MSSNTVLEIERAIEKLSPAEVQELYVWLDEQAYSLDARMESDLAAGLLDDAIGQAMADEKLQNVQPI